MMLAIIIALALVLFGAVLILSAKANQTVQEYFKGVTG